MARVGLTAVVAVVAVVARLNGLAAVGAIGLALAQPSAAQEPLAVRIGSDNDAFTFWLPPWQRTDHEYTSGVYGTLEYAGGSSVLPLGRQRKAHCGAVPSCAVHSFSLGQALYTGEEPPAPGLVPPRHPSRRPNAGWLYIEAAERDSAGRDMTEYRLDAGVVGPPALAEPIQRFFHEIGPAYPKPVDWRHQLPFEPGVTATMVRTHVVAAFGDAMGARGAIAMRGSVSLGTILTGATAGGTGSVSVPIGPAAHDKLWPRLAFSADADLHGVLRDEFLDGTFFRSSDHIAKNAGYDQERASLELQWTRFSAAFRATRAAPQYRLQQAPMVWGTLAVEWRPGER